MAENLFPSGFGTNEITEEEIAEENPPVVGYRKNVSFDYRTGDFLRDGRNNLIECSPFDAWAQWCIKNVQTPRFKCAAYSTDIGIDLSGVIGSSDKKLVESILTAEISECLAADPYGRTDYVKSVKYNWTAPDAVEATATVLGIDQTEITITTTIHL